ncbi:MAG: DUF2203 domain-containing protein [Thermoguttaceae bacterium]|jgi:hypothetical protein|nr:DUF2203 domain-containing protein [Thermoguttaceae bacterium]
MSAQQIPRRKTRFTVQEANACLPLVRAVVRDLVRLGRDVAERRYRLSLLLAGRTSKPRDLYGEELAQIAEEVEKDTRQLRAYVEELEQLGVEARSVTEGVVDFPTVIDGRPAYLCWKYGEPEVLYWHESEAGFADRRPLVAEVGAGESVQACPDNLQ